jgi:hypothetical protein
MSRRNGAERLKCGPLSSWTFLGVTTPWLLKPVSTAAVSPRTCLTVALIALAVWAFCSKAFGPAYTVDSARVSTATEHDEAW